MKWRPRMSRSRRWPNMRRLSLPCVCVYEPVCACMEVRGCVCELCAFAPAGARAYVHVASHACGGAVFEFVLVRACMRACVRLRLRLRACVCVSHEATRLCVRGSARVSVRVMCFRARACVHISIRA